MVMLWGVGWGKGLGAVEVPWRLRVLWGPWPGWVLGMTRTLSSTRCLLPHPGRCARHGICVRQPDCTRSSWHAKPGPDARHRLVAYPLCCRHRGDCLGGRPYPLGGKKLLSCRLTTWVTSADRVFLPPTAPEATEPSAWDKPLDGVNQWPMLARGAPSAREDLLINIERSHPTTAPCQHCTLQHPACDGEGQYAIIKGHYKLLLGGGGLPNTW